MIGGTYRGFRFDPGKGQQMRPTTDRNREALFNILQHRLELNEIAVLDLFAGAGGVSFEFASRGASKVLSVEKNRSLSLFIRSVFERLKFTDFDVKNEDVYRFLKKTPSQVFDLIFADPPYAEAALLQLPELIMESGWLKPGGLLIIEHGSGLFWGGHAPSETRVYGESAFSFFEG